MATLIILTLCSWAFHVLAINILTSMLANTNSPGQTATKNALPPSRMYRPSLCLLFFLCKTLIKLAKVLCFESCMRY